jgi:hypothetical protein
MSTVTIVIADNPNDSNSVDIKWDVSDDEGTGAAKALAAHIVEHLKQINQTTIDNAVGSVDVVTDVEPKE